MARVPEYTQQVFLDRAQPGNIEAAGQIGGFQQAKKALLNVERYQERGESMQRWGAEIQKQRDVQGQLNARQRFNDFQRQKIESMNTWQNERMTKPDGFAEEMDEWHLQSGSDIEDEISNAEDNQPFDMDYFRALMDHDRTSTLESNTNWENGMRVKNITVGTEQTLDGMNSNFALSNPGLKDLGKQIDQIRGYVNTTGAGVLDPVQNHRLATYGIDGASTAVIDNLLVNDPQSLKNVMMYGNGSKGQLINMVMNDFEGGDKVVIDNDGGTAKFGINSKHNNLTPDQVKALTAEDAAAIYAKNYWDPRLDKMTPEMRAVAFDALVQHGNDADTWKMIGQAKGDAYALIALRQQYYGQLAQDPKNLPYKAGWDNRMQKLANYVQTMDGGGREFLEYAKMMDPKTIIAAQNRIPEAMAAKEREQEAIRKQSLTAFNTAFKDTFATMTDQLEPISVDDVNSVKQLAVNTGDADAIAQADALGDLRVDVANLRGMGEADLAKVVRIRSAEVNKNPTVGNRLSLQIAEEVLAKQKQAVAAEGIGYWGRVGQIKMPEPINYGDPTQSVWEIKSREASANDVYQKTGKMMPVLMPDEIDQLKTAFDTMPANQLAGLLTTFDGLDQGAKATLAQAINDKDPTLATALAVDNLEARRRILLGAKMEPAYKKEDMSAQISQILGPMTVDPSFQKQAAGSIMAWYNAKAQEDRDFSEEIDQDRLDDAISQIYGPRVDLAFGGTNEIFSFKEDNGNFVPEDDLYDMFNGITDGQLMKLNGGKLPKGAMGETVTADDIRDNARVVSAGDGLYNVVFDGIGGLYGENGQLVEIDGRALLALYRKDAKKAAREANYQGSDVPRIK